MSDSDKNDLSFLAEKSAWFLNAQIESYRQKHSNAGILLTVIVVFIPFFLTGLNDANLIIKWISLIPVTLLLISLILLILLLRSQALDRGFHTNKLPELINKTQEDILLYEIAANKNSFEDNQIITERANNFFNLAIIVSAIAIILSCALLLTNNFLADKQFDNKNKFMPEKERTLPNVPPNDRTRLNEGANTPKPKANKDEK